MVSGLWFGGSRFTVWVEVWGWLVFLKTWGTQKGEALEGLGFKVPEN